MNRMHLGLLGGFALHDDGGRVLRLPTRKAEALLAYLALQEPARVQRESVAALLWSDADPAAALASLRQGLSTIGKVCGTGWLQAEGRSLRLAPGRFEVDVPAFEAALRSTDVDALQHGSILYRGELLAGLNIDEPDFETWLHAQRQRLHEQALRLHERLGQAQAQAGHVEHAVQATLRLLELEPLHEEGHRQLMRLYTRIGRRAAALRQYQVCVDALRRELATEPEPATRALYHQLLSAPAAPVTDGATRAARHAVTRASADRPVHEAPLIGRVEELTGLLQAFDRARSGHGQVVLLAGEAGVGKSRLADEVIGGVLDLGLRVLVGRCHESQRLLPFAPWAEALRHAGLADDPAGLATLAPWRTELAVLLPEIGPPGAPRPGEGSALARQTRLHEAVTQALASLARVVPALVLIEDLHWADTPSLALLSALVRRGGDWPLMVLGTLRGEDVPETSRLRQVLRELSDAPQGAMALGQLVLQPLDRAQTGLLVRALQGQAAQRPPPGDLAEQVWAVSEGNPWVVVEAVRAARTRPDAWRSAGPTLPERVRDLILSQVQRLGPTARRMLSLMAVSGRETELAVLQHAAELTPLAAAETLEELVRRRLLCLVGEAFDFSHARVRQAVDHPLLAPVRRALHLSLARAIEAQPATAIVARTARLATHFAHADCHAEAVRYLGQQAQDAAHGGAHVLALELLALAREHAARLPPEPAGAHRRELLLRQARSLFFLGRFAEVLALLHPQQQAIDAACDPRVAATYYLRLGSTRTYLGDHAGAVRDAERALAEASSCGDRATMGKAHFLLSLERFWDQPERGVWHGEQALQQLAGSGETWWIGQVCWILGLNLSYRGRFAQAHAMEVRAAALAEETADRRLASYAAWTSGFIHTLDGRLDQAVAACRRSVELALDPLNRMTSLGILSLALVEQGELDEARQLLSEAIGRSVEFRIPQMHGLFLAFRAEAERLAGALPAAVASVARGVEVTREAGYRYGLGWALRVQARVARDSGDQAGAGVSMAQATDTFAAMLATYEEARSQLEHATWLAEDDRPDAALRLARRAEAALQALGLADHARRASACCARFEAGARDAGVR